SARRLLLSFKYAQHIVHTPSFPTRRSSDLFRTTGEGLWEIVWMEMFYIALMHFDGRECAGILNIMISSEVRDGNRESERGTRKTDRKSTRLNSSHVKISYAVFCLKEKIVYP